MAYASPKYSKPEINKAGKILCSELCEIEDLVWAYEVLANWRACHGYSINTFQALLRTKLKGIDSSAIVAQRLKRAPSVVTKLLRFPTMKLSQMQDIGGLRAVVSDVENVKKLVTAYTNSRFKHELVSSKDYIQNPKPDGYRSVHLVYRYKNPQAAEYNDLLIELQFRSKLQHAWATAVETMSTFLGQALKSGQGERPWREFFEISSAALASIENTPLIPEYENLSKQEIFDRLTSCEKDLQVLRKLRGFTIAALSITEEKGSGSYHLVVLDSSSKSVTIRPYPKSQLEQANKDYAQIEERAQKGERIEAVLVSAGPVSALKKAYPNYFLDTHEFVKIMDRVISGKIST